MGEINHPTIKIRKSFYEAKIKMLFFVDFNNEGTYMNRYMFNEQSLKISVVKNIRLSPERVIYNLRLL